MPCRRGGAQGEVRPDTSVTLERTSWTPSRRSGRHPEAYGNEWAMRALSLTVALSLRRIVSTSSTLGFRSDRGPILIALMLSTSLIALDSTILATAVPSIVADLGGLTQFPWLFSVYLLAQAVSVPVYAKLADTLG